MPSPFPGMDPYLEGGLFHDVHQRLAAEISDLLVQQVAPRYVARLATYYLAASVDVPGGIGIIYPDVDVSRAPARPGNGGQGVPQPAGRGGGVAVAEQVAVEPIVLPVPQAHQVKQVTVEVRDREGNQLVTAIEIMSPINKRMPGAEQYQHKRNTYLAGDIHLIEIDLLRQGRRPVEPPGLPAAPYYVFLSRAPYMLQVEVWPIQLADRLPVICVPLRSPDPDVMLDLGAALASIYDRARYDLSIDYSRQPEPALVGDEAVWAADWLRSQQATADQSPLTPSSSGSEAQSE